MNVKIFLINQYLIHAMLMRYTHFPYLRYFKLLLIIISSVALKFNPYSSCYFVCRILIARMIDMERIVHPIIFFRKSDRICKIKKHILGAYSDAGSLNMSYASSAGKPATAYPTCTVHFSFSYTRIS